MGSHDLIVTYKDTEKHDFPLILVIGREPNSESSFTQTIGSYDFDAATKCAFWNTSYASVGAISNRSTYAMKKLCRSLHASPIAFTDASPVPIGNNNKDKRNIRNEITTREIEEHVTNISKMSKIIDRTALVLLSGHRTGALSKSEKQIFGVATTLLAEMFSSKNIPCLSVPFMYGTNQPKIISEISNDEIATNAILDTMEAFTGTGHLSIDGKAA